MSEKENKSQEQRMIHIRLDHTTHRILKVHAAQNSTTIQRLVEDLIQQRFHESRARDAE
jgi:predicted HicB family RNase H-like nuclease